MKRKARRWSLERMLDVSWKVGRLMMLIIRAGKAMGLW
jgi:hypothetical protein